MFESMIAGSVEPEILKLLRLAKTSLGEVRQKQILLANSGDHMTALIAQQVMLQLDAWQPALDVMIAGLEHKPAAPHAPILGGHHS